MTRSSQPISFGLTGLGGFAGYVCDRLIEEQQSPFPAARLIAVCEPEPARYPRRVAILEQHGIALVRQFDQLLAHPIQAVWLPLPIDLHCPFTVSALEAGKAVFCEKPAAGTIDDVDAMIAARDRAKLPVAVGFQDVYQPATAMLKDRLLAGDLGRPLRASVIGCWPRSERYFRRNAWAGRIRRDGRWVLDSPASNALAHFLHLALFLLGPTRQQASLPQTVEAELYRANPIIENYDTSCLRFTIGSGAGDGGSAGAEGEPVPLHVFFTHACDEAREPVVTIECERGRVTYLANRHAEIRTADGEVEILPLLPHTYRRMLASMNHWLRDGAPDTLTATLESARAHVLAVNVASEAAPIIDVPAEFVDERMSDHSVLRAIRGIVPAFESAIARPVLLHDSGAVPWSRPAGSLVVNGYNRFSGPAGRGRPALTIHTQRSTKLPV